MGNVADFADALLTECANKIEEQRDVIRRIRRALDEGGSNTAKLAEISEIMKPYK